MTTVLDSLNHALHQAFRADERVYLLGEDILDPYGGAFKVTRGLSSQFPERVLTTPVSEAGIVGVAAGMALGGLRPVVEIMFGDFITLIADQVINHIAKFRWMYHDQVCLPLVIRTPMGGRRGYGPTHSQTLEKLFLGVPGLRLLAACNLGNPGDLLTRAILEDDNPVLFIENKLLYPLPIIDTENDQDFIFTYTYPDHSHPTFKDAPEYAPTWVLKWKSAPPPNLTIVAYGYMAELARQAVLQLAYEDEIIAELVIPSQIAPFDITPISDSIRKTHRLLVLEEGNYTLGWGAEVIARLAETNATQLHSIRRLAALDLPIPASGPLESAVLPSIENILQIAREMA